jgi:hypothetical protein
MNVDKNVVKVPFWHGMGEVVEGQWLTVTGDNITWQIPSVVLYSEQQLN